MKDGSEIRGAIISHLRGPNDASKSALGVHVRHSVRRKDPLLIQLSSSVGGGRLVAESLRDCDRAQA